MSETLPTVGLSIGCFISSAMMLFYLGLLIREIFLFFNPTRVTPAPTTHPGTTAAVSSQLPSTWAPNRPKHRRFPLDSSSKEYNDVVAFILPTIAAKLTKIIKIERIQKKTSYLQYQLLKKQYREQLGDENEKRLFHGCSEESANSIIKTNFNRSFAGKHGIKYGAGVYFSADAGYSHSYATPNSTNERRLFLCKVLVGKTTLGNESMKTPPEGYNSTTDNCHIFVTYHDTQVYPEYLITYQ